MTRTNPVAAALRSRLVIMGSLRSRNIFLMLGMVLLLTCVTGGYFYAKTYAAMTDRAIREFDELLTRISVNTESQLDNLSSTVTFFSSNPILRKNLQKESPFYSDIPEPMKKIEIERQLSYLLTYNYLWENKLIRSVYLFVNPDTYYRVDHGNIPLSFKQNAGIYDAASPQTPGRRIVPPTRENPNLYIVENMYSEYSLKYIGTLIFAVDAAALSQDYGVVSQYQGARAYVLDEAGNVLLHTDTSLLGARLDITQIREDCERRRREVDIDGEAYLRTCLSLNNQDLYFIVEAPKAQVLADLSRNLHEYLLTLLLILLLFLGITLLASTRANEPLRDLISRIERLRAGDFSARMPKYRDYELDELSTVFNMMADEIERLINDIYKKQLLLKEAELKHLQSQINPHFLFNVLDIISWHARTAGNQEIVGIVVPLAGFLRSHLQLEGSERILIREELKNVDFYLSIQKSRFGDRLEVAYEMNDDGIPSLYIPKFCIQILVENAVVHGLEAYMGKGLLTISLFRRENELHISVTDNGVGFDPSSLHLDDPDAQAVDASGNIGLYNINKRIRLIYGDSYGVRITSFPNSGTHAAIRVPADSGGRE